MMCVFQRQLPATRKSSGFALNMKVGNAIDEVVLRRAKEIARSSLASPLLDEGAEAEHPSQGPGQVQRRLRMVKVITSSLQTFTEGAFFKRVSGDLDQLVGADIPGRVHFGCLINLDEGDNCKWKCPETALSTRRYENVQKSFKTSFISSFGKTLGNTLNVESTLKNRLKNVRGRPRFRRDLLRTSCKRVFFQSLKYFQRFSET